MVSNIGHPISDQTLAKIFKKSSKNNNLIGTNEGVTIEYKESFGWKSASAYFKTMASFANRDGGYIIFGIKDKPHMLLGLTEQSLARFENLDNQEISRKLRERFSPEIVWTKRVFVIDDKAFGIIYTYSAMEKPIICKNGDSELRKGAIYYRYNSQNSEIDYPELKSIIDREKEKINEQWMKTIRQIGDSGIARTALLDLDQGKIISSNSHLYVDESLLQQIEFVKEGSFVETGGNPALKVVGHLQTVVGAQRIIVEKERNRAINADEIILSFITQEEVNNPKEFIKQICYQAAGHLPVHYYIQLAKMSNEESVAYIEGIPINSKSKEVLKRRILCREVKYVPLSSTPGQASSKKRAYLDDLITKVVVIPSDVTEIKYCLSAIRGMRGKEIQENKSYILNLMHNIYTDYFNNPSYSKIKSDFRYTLCWIDEALYLND